MYQWQLEMTEVFSSAPVAAGWTGDVRPFNCSGGSGLTTNVVGGSASLLLASSVVTGGTASQEQTTHRDLVYRSSVFWDCKGFQCHESVSNASLVTRLCEDIMERRVCFRQNLACATSYSIMIVPYFCDGEQLTQAFPCIC